MNKILISAALALLLLIVITGIGFAGAPRMQASGSFNTTSSIMHSLTEEKFNEYIDLTCTFAYTGTLEGTSTLEGTLVMHPDGSTRFRGVETFTGTVNGVPGTLIFKVTGESPPLRQIPLTYIITSGTGELAGLQGVLTKDGIDGTYVGQLAD
jgi:hypothetical protein